MPISIFQSRCLQEPDPEHQRGREMLVLTVEEAFRRNIRFVTKCIKNCNGKFIRFCLLTLSG